MTGEIEHTEERRNNKKHPEDANRVYHEGVAITTTLTDQKSMYSKKQEGEKVNKKDLSLYYALIRS